MDEREPPLGGLLSPDQGWDLQPRPDRGQNGRPFSGRTAPSHAAHRPGRAFFPSSVFTGPRCWAPSLILELGARASESMGPDRAVQPRCLRERKVPLLCVIFLGEKPLFPGVLSQPLSCTASGCGGAATAGGLGTGGRGGGWGRAGQHAFSLNLRNLSLFIAHRPGQVLFPASGSPTCHPAHGAGACVSAHRAVRRLLTCTCLSPAVSDGESSSLLSCLRCPSLLSHLVLPGLHGLCQLGSSSSAASVELSLLQLLS